MPVKWQNMAIAAVLLSQLIVESLHVFFYDIMLSNGNTLGEHIYWLSASLLHIGFLPSILLWCLSKNRLYSSLSLSLVLFSGVKFLMEIVAFWDCDLVTEINSAHYAGLLYLTTCLIISFIFNGLYSSNNNLLINYRLLLSRYNQTKKRT